MDSIKEKKKKKVYNPTIDLLMIAFKVLNCDGESDSRKDINHKKFKVRSKEWLLLVDVKVLIDLIFFQQARVQHTWREEIDFSFENYKII